MPTPFADTVRFAWLAALLAAAAVLMPGPAPASAQPLPPDLDESFPVEDIPPAWQLMNESDAVFRLHSTRFEVSGPGEATLRVRSVVTILGPGAHPSYGRVAVHYDTFREVKELDGRLLDAAGEEIRDLSSDDVGDFSNIQGFSLYEQNRVRTAELTHDQYPYTVEFEYEVAYTGVIGWPTWTPQFTTAPVQHTLFEIATPPSLPARYAARHTGEAVPARPETRVEDGRRLYQWSAAALPPRTPEPYSLAWKRRYPRVHTAPSVFEIDGRRGTMDSWSDYGQWVYDLNADVDQGSGALPPDVVQDVHDLVGSLTDRREKVRRLYRYMQDRTRYVSVQLGIGGWRAFSPAYVIENGYGDCKALVYFMRALLREAGIPSHAALLKLDRVPAGVLTELPSQQFNHVILAVPMEEEPNGQERIWLECTSQTAAFAHIGAAGEGRQALLVKDGASRLVHVPASTAGQNARHRRTRVRLAEDGTARAEVDARYTGNRQDRVRARYAEAAPRERQERLRQQMGLPSVKIVESDFSSIQARRDTLRLPMRLQAPQYAARTGPRLFLRPNLLLDERPIPAPVASGERTQPVSYFAYPHADVDSVAYALPDGFVLEAAPAPVEIETPFARYEAAVEHDPETNTLRYYRRLEVTHAELPAEQYEPFRAFIQQVARADRAQVVLVEE